MVQQFAPAAFFSPLFIPVDNPYVPDDLRSLLESRPDPLEDIGLQKRLSEAGPRISDNTYDVYQLTLGLSGTVFDDWEYDVYAQIGANDQEYRQTGNVLLSRAEELTFAPDGGVSICGGFDPFGLGLEDHELRGAHRRDADLTDQPAVENVVLGQRPYRVNSLSVLAGQTLT